MEQISGRVLFTIILLSSFLLQLINQSEAAVQNLSYEINEELPINAAISDVIVDSKMMTSLPSDIDRTRVRFTMRDTTESRYLQIDERTGIVRIRSRIDREAICPYLGNCEISAEITATFPPPPRDYSLAFRLTFRIFDLNDNAPIFAPTAISLDASPNPGGNLFPLPAADDRDSPRYGLKEYRLAAGASGPGDVDSSAVTRLITEKRFELRSVDLADGSKVLWLQLNWSTDMKSPAQGNYLLSVEAVDGGTPSLSGILQVYYCSLKHIALY